jgi:hypothetical protein
MKRVHPNSNVAGALAALALVGCLAGCRTPSGGIANPFLAPDRVPPPATRAILPGQAQPYYPGDPLPVMQSQAAPPSPSGGLAWSAGADQAPSAAGQSAAPSRATLSEATVAIPADNDSLRFAPARDVEPQPSEPVAPTPIQVAATATNSNSNGAVTQASYTEPVLTSVEPPVNPWRQPQVAQPPLPPPPAIPPAPPPVAATPPYYSAQPAVEQSGMAVRLRAIASPPPEPPAGSAPRIRLPGEVALESASHDGFRPRTSMR